MANLVYMVNKALIFYISIGQYYNEKTKCSVQSELLRMRIVFNEKDSVESI